MRIIRLLLFLIFTECFAAGLYAQDSRDSELWEYLISDIRISGNKKTSSEYIIRELTIKTGQQISLDSLNQELAKSRINLVNTGLFINHEIRLWYEIIDRSTLVIEIFVSERWYFWPEPVLQNAERNFNVWLADPDLQKINWGVNFIQDNVLGGNERLNLVLRFGYDEKYEIGWSDPSIMKSRILGLKAGFGFSGNHEVAYMASGNRLKLIRTDDYIQTGYYGFAQISLRPSINYFHNLLITVKDFRISDTLLVLNPGYIPGSSGRFVSADLSYLFKMDFRDHKAYPLQGGYADFELRQTGISLSDNESGSFTSALCNVRAYNRLYDKLYMGTGIAAFVSPEKNPPFMLRNGLGYGRLFVRGFEYDVMHGFAWCLLKHNIKYAIIPERAVNLSYMPHEKFRNASLALYLNLFADAGYVFGNNADVNDLVNTSLFSAGIGLDIVTYYDKVMRIEASLNKLGKVGLAINFIAPI